MIFKRHNSNLYNILLLLSRNIFFYKKIVLSDNFETRLYLIFIHFSILMIIFKKKNSKFDQKLYDSLFYNIENNLRELGFGDVTVNKKMKIFNKILYDILLKIDNSEKNNFELNHQLISSYFSVLNNEKDQKYIEFKKYFDNFYDFCFALPLNSMIDNISKFKY